MCKFGASCKYHHPRQGGGSGSSVALNISGYPLRPVCFWFTVVSVLFGFLYLHNIGL